MTFAYDHATYAQAAKAHQLHGGDGGGGKGGGKGGKGGKGGGRGGGSGGGGGEEYWVSLLSMLQRENLLPAVIFSFSKARRDDCHRLPLIDPHYQRRSSPSQ